MIQMFTKKRKKGFTLIELVVVVAILGILVAIAIPRLSGSRDNASRKAILSNLRTIDSAITIATAEGKTVAAIEGDVTSPAIALVPTYLAKTPTSVAGEAYTIVDGRATATFEASDIGVTKLGASAGSYTVETLLAVNGWSE